jgi:hypothetical protein
MVDNAYSYGTWPELHNKILKALKPWPGDVSRMEIDP